MPNFLIGGLRSLAQAAWLSAGRYVAQRFGWEFPTELPIWLDGVIMAAAFGAWAGLVQWMESRPHDSLMGKLGRAVARVVVFGIRAQPAYGPRGRDTNIVTPDPQPLAGGGTSTSTSTEKLA